MTWWPVEVNRDDEATQEWSKTLARPCLTKPPDATTLPLLPSNRPTPHTRSQIVKRAPGPQHDDPLFDQMATLPCHAPILKTLLDFGRVTLLGIGSAQE